MYLGNPYDYPVEKLTDAVTHLAVSDGRSLRIVLEEIRQTTPFLTDVPPKVEGLSEDSLKKFYALRDRLNLSNELREDVHDIVTSMCALAFQLCEERGRVSPSH